ncbi:hypothetical protein ACHAXT_003504 [Thalassiosira profunda]
MHRTSVTYAGGAAAAPLPATYREALEALTSSAVDAPLASISDESVLSLAKELLSHFYATKDEWTAGNWTAEEAKLYRLEGSAAEFSRAATKQVLAAATGDYLRTFVEGLEWRLGKGNEPDLVAKRRNAAMDGEVAEVYGPVGLSPLYPGNSFEVWTSPSGKNVADSLQEEKKEEDGLKDVGPVAVVLGAGNQSMLTMIDVLDSVLRGRRPVLVKHHPIRPWLAEPYGVILEPLAKRGYFAQVPDVSIEVTKTLLMHRAVGHVHITGALKTAQAVAATLVEARPELSADQIRSMITSELGCATPQIVDDGEYTDSELQHMAQIITVGKKGNGGCNCLSAQVVLLPKRWAQKDLFRAKLMEELKRQPTAPCYYPGSVERKTDMIQWCENVDSKCTMVEAPPVTEGTVIGDADQVVVVECGTPSEEGYNPVPLKSEAFGPVLAVVELDSGVESDVYLAKTAVPFVNNKGNIFGSLSCSVFTPVSKGKTYEREGLQSALAELQYGGISVNQWNLFGYLAAMKGGMWGGHPKEKLGQSGNGYIGDLYGVIGEKDAKVVVYGPSLTNKPLFDLANNPPPIVLDVLTEIACAPNGLVGTASVLKMVVARSFCGIVSYIPFIGGLFQ